MKPFSDLRNHALLSLLIGCCPLLLHSASWSMRWCPSHATPQFLIPQEQQQASFLSAEAMHLAQPVHLLSPSTLVVVCGAPSSRCPTRGKLRWRFFRSRGGALSCVAEGAAAASVFSNNRHLRMFFAESRIFWNSAFASCLYVYLYPRSQQFWLFISVAVDVLDPPRAKYGLDRARRARHASGAVHSSARIMRLSGILR